MGRAKSNEARAGFNQDSEMLYAWFCVRMRDVIPPAWNFHNVFIGDTDRTPPAHRCGSGDGSRTGERNVRRFVRR